MSTSLSITNLDWLTSSVNQLDKAGIGTAWLDSLVLMEDNLHQDRSWILAHPESVIPSKSKQVLSKQLQQRSKHVPLAYIRSKSEFYGRDFYIDERVLEPRPESETMIDCLKNLLNNIPSISKNRLWKNTTIIDVGTGSGALAITAKLEFPKADVLATDIDPGCLNVARKNAKNLQAGIKFYKSDLLAAIPSSFYLLTSTILANLPYVPDSHTVNSAAGHEPRSAIFGGADGLDLYRRLFQQLRGVAVKPRLVLTEALPFQHLALAAIAKRLGYVLRQTDDFIQVYASLY